MTRDPGWWIVNLLERVVEVRRKAITDPDAEFGYSYAELVIYRPGQTISPLGARRQRCGSWTC